MARKKASPPVESTTVAQKQPQVIDSGTTPEIFADGLQNTWFGPILTKLVFYSVKTPMAPSGAEGEVRHVNQIVTVPTAALLEFLVKMRTIILDHSDQLVQHGSDHQEGIVKSLRELANGPDAYASVKKNLKKH